MDILSTRVVGSIRTCGKRKVLVLSWLKFSGLFLFLISMFNTSQGQTTVNGIVCKGDSLLRRVEIGYYNSGCLERLATYEKDEKVECLYFNTAKDTLYYFRFYENGQVSVEEVFYFNNGEGNCFDFVHEGLYEKNLLFTNEYSPKGYLVTQTKYEFKLNPRLGEYVSVPTIAYFYRKKKVVQTIRYYCDDKLNITRNVER